jgi:hypothetical protein
MPLVNKTFSDIITFDRASSATMFDSSGTLVYAPMNLLTYSEEFDTTPNWNPTRTSVTADAAVAPDGNTTADSFIEDNTAASTHNMGQGFSFTAGVRYTFSVFAKATASPRFLQLIFPSGAFGATRRPVFDLVNGTAAAATDTTASIESVGNGWYRCVASMLATNTNSASLQFQLADTYTNSNALYDGDNTSGLYIWGAQLNIANMQGGVTADLSTYYPTTSAAYQGPRFDYDPATLAARGLLIEEQRTNLLLWSEDFSQATWTKTRSSITADSAISPDGTQDADKLVEDTTAASTHDLVVSSISFTSGLSYTVSFYAKRSGRNIRLYFPSAVFGTAFSSVFNLEDGTSSAAVSGSVSSITDAGNGWYRCTMTQTATASATSSFTWRLIEDASTISYTGDGTSGIFIWGAQLEVGAFPTSYIPTTTTSLTRSADVASVNTLSPWFNASEGTILVEASPQASNVASILLTDLNTAVTDRISLAKLITSGNASLAVLVASVTQVSTNSGPWTATGKFAGAYKLNDFASSLNGSAAATDTSGTIPAVTQLFLGRRADGANILNGYLRRVTYYPRRLSDAELQAITA